MILFYEIVISYFKKVNISLQTHHRKLSLGIMEIDFGEGTRWNTLENAKEYMSSTKFNIGYKHLTY